MPKKISREIPPGYKPRRLDVALHDMGVFSSRSQAKRAIEAGRVKLAGAETKSRHIVKPGDRVVIFLPDPIPATPRPEDIPLHIIHEDDDMIVINKPAGMVVHPGAGNISGTVVNAVLFHCGNLSGIGGVMRPGVVHRLDKETSGVLVMAKNDLAHQSLSKQFQQRSVHKTYIAIVFGRMPRPEGTIESSISRHPTRRIKMRGRAGEGRRALTRFRELEVFPGASLLELTPETGRTHQIRVHLSEAGHPVVGDKIYGTRKRIKSIENMQVRTALANLERHALHAHSLTITHPKSEERLTFVSPLPTDMRDAVEALKNAATPR